MCIYDNGSQAKNVSTSENFMGCIACLNCPLSALNVATTKRGTYRWRIKNSGDKTLTNLVSLSSDSHCSPLAKQVEWI